MRTSFFGSVVVMLVVGCVAGCATAPGADSADYQDSSSIDQSPVEQTDPNPAENAGEEYNNTLKWTTASEVDNFGFDIYRSTSEDGPFEKITEEPIPGAGTTDEPQDYVYVDDEIDPTQGYFYYIESISLASIREVFSPVIAIGPKKPKD